MPELDGLELTRVIKADRAVADTAVILLTSVKNLAESRHMRAAGCIVCLTKPVRSAQLLSALQAAASAKHDPTSYKSIVALEKNCAMSGYGSAASSPLRALVVEDNVVNQKVAVRLLEKLGLHADVAANGRQAIEMLGLWPYDVVFMDCQMPVLDGYGATVEIRRHGPNQSVRIVAMTADVTVRARERCMESGMDDFITKPVSRESVRLMVEKWAAPCAPGGLPFRNNSGAIS
jgi:CheY-like chemotaxis protein